MFSPCLKSHFTQNGVMWHLDWILVHQHTTINKKFSFSWFQFELLIAFLVIEIILAFSNRFVITRANDCWPSGKREHIERKSTNSNVLCQFPWLMNAALVPWSQCSFNRRMINVWWFCVLCFSLYIYLESITAKKKNRSKKRNSQDYDILVYHHRCSGHKRVLLNVFFF